MTSSIPAIELKKKSSGLKDPKSAVLKDIDWLSVAKTMLRSRELDRIEETELTPQGLVTYQFSARGHDLAQAILSECIDHPHDGAGVYYRSRPFVLGQGLTSMESAAGSLALAGGTSNGRDIGVVHSLRPRGKGTVLPASGDVGAQYSPAVGWAQAVKYYTETLEQSEYQRAIAVALGGDGSTASNGFWAALNIATTQQLPMLFLSRITDTASAYRVNSKLREKTSLPILRAIPIFASSSVQAMSPKRRQRAFRKLWAT